MTQPIVLTLPFTRQDDGKKVTTGQHTSMLAALREAESITSIIKGNTP